MELWVDPVSGEARTVEYVPAVLERGKRWKRGTFLVTGVGRRILARSTRYEAIRAVLAGCHQIDPRPRCAAVLQGNGAERRCIKLASATRIVDQSAFLVCGTHKRAAGFCPADLAQAVKLSPGKS